MEVVESLSLLHLQSLHFDSSGPPPHHQPYIKPQEDFHREHHSQSYNHYHQLTISDNVDRGHEEYHQHQHHHFSSFAHGNLTSLHSSFTRISGEEESTSVIIKATDPYSTPTAYEDELPLRLPMWGVVILITGYLIVFLLGVIGNCSVLFIVTKLKRMKTVTNYFIFNLAIADLLVLLFCLLPNLVSNIFIPWVLGPFLCKIVPYIQGVSVCASIYFLVALSLERCVSIQWPFKYQITKEKAKIIICSIWLWSCVFAIPWAMFFQSGAFDEDNPQLEFCIEKWPEHYEHWQNYYFIFGNLFLCYLFPLGVILICYLTIWFRVYRRPVPSDCYHVAIELIHQRSKTAVVKMLIVVVLIFALTWLPLYIIIIRLKFGPEIETDWENDLISFVFAVAQWLLSVNSCVNPIIYSFLNNRFRRAFIEIVKGDQTKRIRIKHKSPTVNILLKRFSTYRVETTMSKDKDNSYDSI